MSLSQIDAILVPLLFQRARIACGSECRKPNDPSLTELDLLIETLRKQRLEAVEQELGYLI